MHFGHELLSTKAEPSLLSPWPVEERKKRDKVDYHPHDHHEHDVLLSTTFPSLLALLPFKGTRTTGRLPVHRVYL